MRNVVVAALLGVTVSGMRIRDGDWVSETPTVDEF